MVNIIQIKLGYVKQPNSNKEQSSNNVESCILVSEIQCSIASSSSSTPDILTARLKKPSGFKGAPLFADDRSVNPEADRECSIQPEVNDPDSLAYTLKITDFKRCGVLKRNVKSPHFYIFSVAYS